VALPLSWVPDSGWPLPLSKPIGLQNGGKMPKKGAKLRVFGKNLRDWLWHNSLSAMRLR
jgi:hypothetical protein